jgi:hypothetical protein
MEPFSLEDFLRQYPVLAKHMEDHPLMGDLSKDYPRAEVDAIQASMVEGASHFLDSQFDDLRCVIRLTVEFFHRLQRVDIDSIDDDSLLYWGGSVFSGVDSFTSLSQAYRVTAGATRSALPQRVTSRAALKEEFTAMYREFAGETNFEKRCRLLLDLFKLQIIFVGMTYD